MKIRKITNAYLISITLLCAGCAPMRSPEDAFLIQFFRDSDYKKNLEYRISPNHPVLASMMKSLHRDTLRQGRKHEYLVLTSEERTAVINGLQNTNASFTLKRVLSNATFLSEDTLKIIFSSQQRDNSIPPFRGRLYHFTPPVMIRNNSICIFYYSYHCGEECGEGHLAVFKKTFWGWKSYLKIHGWKS